MTNKLIEHIKILRDKTGVSFLECKKALEKSNLNIENAVIYLRENNKTIIQKIKNKKTLEGLITLTIKNNKAVISEVNCETDFVAKNKNFINFCKNINEYFFNIDDESFYIKNDEIKLNETLENEKIDLIGKLKENILIRRLKKIYTKNNLINGYAHGPENFGKTAALIITKDIKNDNYDTIKKEIAMQIVSMKPEYLNIESIPQEIIENEKHIINKNIEKQNKNKDDKIKKKIFDNNIIKYYEKIVLMEQYFIKNDKIKIKNLINDKFEIIDYTKFEVGDNINDR